MPYFADAPSEEHHSPVERILKLGGSLYDFHLNGVLLFAPHCWAGITASSLDFFLKPREFRQRVAWSV